MVTLAECLMTAVLIVVTPPAHSSYDAPTMGGTCHAMIGQAHASIYVDETHKLIIEYAYIRYEIPLPVKAGTFNIRYILGSQQARLQRTSHDPDAPRLGQELVDSQWFTVMVRFGPKEMS